MGSYLAAYIPQTPLRPCLVHYAPFIIFRRKSAYTLGLDKSSPRWEPINQLSKKLYLICNLPYIIAVGNIISICCRSCIYYELCSKIVFTAQKQQRWYANLFGYVKFTHVILWVCKSYITYFVTLTSLVVHWLLHCMSKSERDVL